MARWIVIVAVAAAASMGTPGDAGAHSLSMAGVRQMVSVEWQDASWDLQGCKRHGAHRVACSIEYYSDSDDFWQDEIFTLRGRSLYRRTVSYGGVGNIDPPTVSTGPAWLVPDGTFDGAGEFALRASVQPVGGGWTGYQLGTVAGPSLQLRCPDGTTESRELSTGSLGTLVHRDGSFVGTWPATGEAPEQDGMRYVISGRFSGLSVAGAVRATLTNAAGGTCVGRLPFRARLRERLPRYIARAST